MYFISLVYKDAYVSCLLNGFRLTSLINSHCHHSQRCNQQGATGISDRLMRYKSSVHAVLISWGISGIFGQEETSQYFPLSHFHPWVWLGSALSSPIVSKNCECFDVELGPKAVTKHSTVQCTWTFLSYCTYWSGTHLYHSAEGNADTTQ